MAYTILRSITNSLFEKKTILRRGEDELWIKDKDLRGFYVREKPDGTRIFIFRWKSKDGKNRSITIGIFGSDGDVPWARAKAEDMRKAIRDGRDPSEEQRKSLAQVRTINAALDEFYKLCLIPGAYEPATIAEYKRLLEKVRPTLGEKHVGDIAFAHVQILHSSMEETPREANNLVTVFRLFVNWCAKMGYRDPRLPSISDGLKWFPEESRERPITGDELTRFLTALNALRVKEAISEHFYYLIWIMVFSGARLGQVQSLKWDQVKFESNELILKPKNRRARGRTKPKEDKRRLVGHLRNILEDLWERRDPADPWVFPADNKSGHMTAVKRPWKTLLKEAGIEDLRRHDLRHHYGTEAVEAGIQPSIRMRMLGHSRVTTGQRYEHPSSESLGKAQEKVGKRIVKKGGSEPLLKPREKKAATSTRKKKPIR